MKFDTDLYNEHDMEAAKKLRDFLPDKIFDAHTHFFDCDFVPGLLSSDYVQKVTHIEDYDKFMGELLGHPKKIRLNIISHPDKTMADKESENIKKSDNFLLGELNKNAENVGEIIVHPEESAEEIEKRITSPQIKGFKCYHLNAKKDVTWNCNIEEYLPEGAWEVANKNKLCITLHMVKDDALADENNQKYICEMAKKYPDAVLILAHAARSFASWTGVESVEKVAKFDNVWYDFSAVCESPAMFMIMKKAGVEKCMWGSDFPVCTLRGKAISLADTFYWIYENDINNFSSKTKVNSYLVATENLMATRQACIMADLSQSQIEDLFYNNAARLFDR